MPAATIMFLDIVGFSRNPNSRQRELVDSLTSEVTSGLSSLINPPLETPHVVAMPTGDGMALAFLHQPNQPWDISTIMSLIYRVEGWAKDRSVNLRIGVHAGEVEFITDINNKTNIVGDTINYAQRVMDAANPKQVLFSDVAFRQYIGSNPPSYSGPPYSPGCKAIFEGPYDVQAKHGMRMLVYKMTLDPAKEWLSNEDPASKNFITKLEPTEARKGQVKLWGKYKWFIGASAVAVAIVVAGVIVWLNQPAEIPSEAQIVVSAEAEPKNDGGIAVPTVPKEIELSHDDGIAEVVLSPSQGGYLVSFSPPSVPFVVKKIRMYGMRRASQRTEFQIQIWDKAQKAIFSSTHPFTVFPLGTAADAKWVELEVPDIEIGSDFFIHLYTGNFKEEGIAIGADNSVINRHSDLTIIDPGGTYLIRAGWTFQQGNWWTDKTKVNWMIRVAGPSPR